MLENNLNYILIRSRRKTTAICITKNATIKVRAPINLPKADIDEFVSSKEKWIRDNLRRRMLQISKRSTFSINYGDLLPFCGNEYLIKAKDGHRLGFDGDCFYIPSGLPEEEIKPAAVQLYKIAAKQILTNKVVNYAMQMGVNPTSVKINGAKTRWGSCSGKNSLNFSWRLVMASDESIDYVVVHELAHIIEHNHSERFWAVVAAVFPDYKERQAKLVELQSRLVNENWD